MRRGRPAGTSGRIAALIAILVVPSFGIGYLTGSGLTTTVTGTATSISSGTATSQGSGVVNETIFIHVVNSTSGEPVSNESLTAGPASSSNDVSYTWGMNIVPTLNECVHEVGNGSTVLPNGDVVSNGTTTAYAPCPLKNYVTNATGWVTISNQNAGYFFVFVGTVLNTHGSNVQVVAMQGSRTYVTVTFPQANFTVSGKGGFA
jgi:hypothetical protein